MGLRRAAAVNVRIGRAVVEQSMAADGQALLPPRRILGRVHLGQCAGHLVAETEGRHGAADGQSRKGGLYRASIRRDGFVSADAGYGGGAFTTPAFTFDGRRLHVNVDGSAAGWMKVEVRGADGAPLPGYGLADADAVMGNGLNKPVTWKGKPDLPISPGTAVRLHVVMRDMKLFAFEIA